MELRARVQQIALTHRRNYGYRRVCRELKDQGWRVNHKRVARIMAEDNLLAIRRRKYIVTTDSGHDLPVYRNLAAKLKLSGINQLWVADITYIRLRQQFLFLAVVLDAYSRRVVGWALEESLEAFLPMAALRKAIAERQPGPGLVHHSDRGTQYASREYIVLLEQHGMEPSNLHVRPPLAIEDRGNLEVSDPRLHRVEIVVEEQRHHRRVRVRERVGRAVE